MKFKFYALKLSGLCILIFFIQLIVPGLTESLLLSQDHALEIWRFLTSLFLHSGIPHLLYNIFALALFGSILESLIGGKKFLFVYFISGIGANIIAIFFYPSSLGASGAIYGIIGALMFVKPSTVVFAFGLPMPIILAGILWAGGDLIGLFNPTSNTGYIAHLAGMAIGLILGASYRDWYKKKERREIVKLPEHHMRKWEDAYLR